MGMKNPTSLAGFFVVHKYLFYESLFLLTQNLFRFASSLIYPQPFLKKFLYLLFFQKIPTVKENGTKSLKIVHFNLPRIFSSHNTQFIGRYT